MFFKCKEYADDVLGAVKENVEYMKEAGISPRGLAIVTAGDDAASAAYMKGKIKDCEFCGFPAQVCRVESREELRDTLYRLNSDPSVGGIITQLPLPKELGFTEEDEAFAKTLTSLDKDVDGFKRLSRFSPCTPKGIIHIMKREGALYDGGHVVILGRGKLVGAPLREMLDKLNCTVSVCNSKTPFYVKNRLIWAADVVVSATGKPESLDLDFLGLEPLRNESAKKLVIDCGVHRVNGKLVGDVKKTDFAVGASNIRITDVPGGVGLMTRAILMMNMMEAQP